MQQLWWNFNLKSISIHVKLFHRVVNLCWQNKRKNSHLVSHNHLSISFFFCSVLFCKFFILYFLIGTSTRKPRLNSALAAQQAATLPGASGVPNGNPKPPKMSRSKTKHKRYPARLTNVDRSSAQTCEVTLNSVTVVITEYKPKSVTSSSSRRESSEQSYSESNDSRS